MSQWLRVFGCNATPPETSALLECLRELGASGAAALQADPEDWLVAELELSSGLPSLRIERFLVTEEGIRHELNSWAAWVESVENSANHRLLMHHIVSTMQLFTCEIPATAAGEDPIEKICVGLCRFLARKTKGIYQIDGHGFFSASGTLLIAER